MNKLQQLQDEAVKRFRNGFVKGTCMSLGYILMSGSEIRDIDDFLTTEIARVWNEATKETSKAFGGCTSCYGKGYSTVKTYLEGAEDFGGEGFRKENSPYVPCAKCERGEQIKAMLDNLNK